MYLVYLHCFVVIFNQNSFSSYVGPRINKKKRKFMFTIINRSIKSTIKNTEIGWMFENTVKWAFCFILICCFYLGFFFFGKYFLQSIAIAICCCPTKKKILFEWQRESVAFKFRKMKWNKLRIDWNDFKSKLKWMEWIDKRFTNINEIKKLNCIRYCTTEHKKKKLERKKDSFAVDCIQY